MLFGDTPWSLAVQCTNAQIDSYLADRAAKGCNAILINAIEAAYSNQSPAYRNIEGAAPFTVMTPAPNWILNEAYWSRVDHIVNQCKARGIVCFLAPAYTGYGGGVDGWSGAYSSASDTTLQAYGAALARRYTQGNVAWVLGGDSADDNGSTGAYGSNSTPKRTRQWQIALGIRSVRTTDLITGHTGRNTYGGAVDGESYKAWGGGSYVGWNLNNVYGLDDVIDVPGLAATAYGRSGPLPFFLIEAGYQNIDGENTSARVPAIQCVLGGGLGGFFAGHDVLWHMGSYSPDAYGAATALSRYLAGSWTDFKFLSTLLSSYRWDLLQPRRDGSLVTSSLGSGGSSICPARASDGSFAMVFVPGSSTVTVNLAALAPTAVRARWFDVRTGTFASASTALLGNSGSRSFSSPGERILVLDAG